MLKFVEGDLFLSSAQTLAHGVNCEGFMGKGVALEMKNNFPYMFAEYRFKCKTNHLKPGGVFLYKNDYRVNAPWILNLATQESTFGAKEEYVENCFNWIADNYDLEGIDSIAMPIIGSGLGRLNSNVIVDLMESILGVLPIPVFVYEKYVKGLKAEEYDINIKKYIN